MFSFGKFCTDFKELGFTSGILDRWQLPQAELLLKIFLHSSALLINERGDYCQTHGKYFCVPWVVWVFSYQLFFSDP